MLNQSKNKAPVYLAATKFTSFISIFFKQFFFFGLNFGSHIDRGRNIQLILFFFLFLNRNPAFWQTADAYSHDTYCYLHFCDQKYTYTVHA